MRRDVSVFGHFVETHTVFVAQYDSGVAWDD
jgi:hypothetical protein